MPELTKKSIKVTSKQTTKSKASTTASKKSSGVGKISDSKQTTETATSQNPTRNRPPRRKHSSESSDSDSAASSTTDSSQSSVSPRRKNAQSKDGKTMERTKSGTRTHNPPSSNESVSKPPSKLPESQPLLEQSKKGVSKLAEAKRFDSTSRPVTTSSTSEPTGSKSTKHAAAVSDRGSFESSVANNSDAFSKQVTKGELGLEKTTKERSASPPFLPPFTRVLVEKLTRNVNKAHITEIFSVWGKIQSVDMPCDRLHPEFSRSYAYITYEKPSSAADAVNFMNGGQIDGEVVRVTEILSRSSLLKRGDRNMVNDDKTRDRERDTERSGVLSRPKHEIGTAAGRMDEQEERPRERDRRSTELEHRKDKQRDRERDRERIRDHSRERGRPREDRSRRTRRGSSASPFASRPVPPSNRQRSPAGSRYRRPSPPASRTGTTTGRRARSRSPIAKPQQPSKPALDGKSSVHRARDASSRSSSSSSSDSDSSNSSSTSRSDSTSSSSSSSSRSRS